MRLHEAGTELRPAGDGRWQDPALAPWRRLGFLTRGLSTVAPPAVAAGSNRGWTEPAEFAAAEKRSWEETRISRTHFFIPSENEHSRSLEIVELWEEIKSPTQATAPGNIQSLFLPKLMRESSALPAKGRKSNRPSDGGQQSSSAAEMSSDFAGRQASAFYTCLAVPVEGATPIQDQETQPKSISSQSTATPKRAPRKSKTDALAAMQIQANSSDDKSQSSYQVTGVRTFDDPGPPIAISPVLDMNSVKTTSPRNPLPRRYPRPFGLEDCPVYYPTMDEFKDPLGYIRSASENAKNYGICKIVPPESWKMPFTTDTEVPSSAIFSRRARWLTPFLDPRPSVSRHGYSASTLSRRRREPKSTSWNSCIDFTNSRGTLVFPSRR